MWTRGDPGGGGVERGIMEAVNSHTSKQFEKGRREQNLNLDHKYK
jgi:hypothetical protein